MRILVIEDDINLQASLKAQLEQANYCVDVASDGEIGLFQAVEFPYDAAVIDVGLPKLNGIELTKKLREQNFNFPILLLTARDSWQDKVQGLEAGADDYVTKPFHNEELLARLNALIRRAAGRASPVLSNGPLRIDMASMAVTLNDVAIKLSGHEYKLLEYLMLHIDEVKSKAVLTEHIYDQDFDLDSNVIEVFIRRLRKKIDPENQIGLIETLRGQGYKLNRLATT